MGLLNKWCLTFSFSIFGTAISKCSLGIGMATLALRQLVNRVESQSSSSNEKADALRELQVNLSPFQPSSERALI